MYVHLAKPSTRAQIDENLTDFDNKKCIYRSHKVTAD